MPLRSRTNQLWTAGKNATDDADYGESLDKMILKKAADQYYGNTIIQGITIC
jgi:hypothetical protein